jgi:hypothetical protein
MTDRNDADDSMMWDNIEKAIAAISSNSSFILDQNILKEILTELNLHDNPTPSIQKCVKILASLCRNSDKTHEHTHNYNYNYDYNYNYTYNHMHRMSTWVKRPIVSVILDSLATVLGYGGYFAVIDTPLNAASEAWLGEVLLRSMYHMGCRNAVSGSLLHEVVCAPNKTEYAPAKELGHPKGWYMPFADFNKTFYAPLVRPETLFFHKKNADENISNDPVFQSSILRRIEIMLRIYEGSLVAAGGSVLSMLRHGTTFSDVDIFLIGNKTPQEYTDIIQDAIAFLTSDFSDFTNSKDMDWTEVVMLMTDNTVTINIGYHSKIQFVLSPYTDIEQLLSGFDLSSCKVAWDGHKFYAMPSADVSAEFGINILDPLKVSIIKRAYKYNQRGFRFIAPVWGHHYESIVDMQMMLPSIGDDEQKKVIAYGGIKGLVAMAILSDKIDNAIYDVFEHSEAMAMYNLRTEGEIMNTYLEHHPTFYIIRVYPQYHSEDIIKYTYDGRLRHFGFKNVPDIIKYIMPSDIKSIIVCLIDKKNYKTASLSLYEKGIAQSFYDIYT